MKWQICELRFRTFLDVSYKQVRPSRKVLGLKNLKRRWQQKARRPIKNRARADELELMKRRLELIALQRCYRSHDSIVRKTRQKSSN